MGKVARLLKFYGPKPWLLYYAVKFKFYQRKNPDRPWLSPKAVEYCDSLLNSSMIGFEWGSGRSTRWFSKRLKFLHSVEQDQGWHNFVMNSLGEQKIENVNYYHIEVDGHENSLDKQLPYVEKIEEFPDNHFDFIVVDGHFRQQCLHKAQRKLKNGGHLLLDNSNWLPRNEWNVPTNWPLKHESTNHVTQTSIWMKPIE